MSEKDPIEKAIGKFGKYQMWILFLVTVGRNVTNVQLNNVVFILPSVDYICLDETADNATNYCPCQNPEYDQTTIVSSVTSEWNLICEKKHWASLSQSILQIGILVGSFLNGYMSDRFGRKPAIIMSYMSNAIFSSLSGLVPDFWMFLVLRFLIGAAVGGSMLCSFVHAIELCGKSFRPYLVGMFDSVFVIGYGTLPIIAYYVREWRTLQLVTSVPWLLVFTFYWLIPESPRWLITMGRKKEAIDVLTTITKKNKRPVENMEQLVDEFETISKRDAEKPANYIDLFKTSNMRVYTIVSGILWMCCAHTFYGINQYIGRLQGNIYLNVLLSACSLFPGLIVMSISAIYLKRKLSIVIHFFVAGIALFVFIFIPNNLSQLVLTFAIIGQIGAYVVFNQLYLFTSEVFPTILRNSAMGFSSILARFGGFIAPFIVNIGVEWGSMLAFSLVAFLGGIFCFLMPETKDIVLPNTITQVETNTSKKKPQVI